MDRKEEQKGLAQLPIHHTGYVVANLDEMLAHLAQAYGLVSEEPYDFIPDRAWVNGNETDSYVLRIAMVKTENGSILEFIQPIKGKGVHQQFLDAGKSGIQHVCFSVTEYDYWHAFFEEKDADIVFEAEVEDERFGYRRCFYAQDQLTGMMFEIKEEPYFREKE